MKRGTTGCNHDQSRADWRQVQDNLTDALIAVHAKPAYVKVTLDLEETTIKIKGQPRTGSLLLALRKAMQ